MSDLAPIYHPLTFPPAPEDRPYCYINMVTTIDGKILSGDRDDHVLDLGSKVDHVLMKRIEASADAVIVGGQTLRVSPPQWTPAPKTRIAVSISGDLPYQAKYFHSDHAYVATSESATFHTPKGVLTLTAGQNRVDFALLLLRLRKELGIHRLVILGGSDLNAQLLKSNLVDELFVTIAPKVKLGRDVPTYADGDALSREDLQRYHLIEHHAIGDEIFIRYRREGLNSNAPHTTHI
jgi:riboflavin biosynthesis pyrimidine reductase